MGCIDISEFNRTTACGEIRLKVKGPNGTAIPDNQKSLLDYLAGAGVFLEANCGGLGACGKCRVKIVSGHVVGQRGDPLDPLNDGTYLACRAYPAGEVAVSINQAGACTKGEMTEPKDQDLSPAVKKFLVKPEYPSVSNHHSLQEMIRRASGGPRPVNIHFLNGLANMAQRGDSEYTLVVFDREITAIETGDTLSDLYGVAFDIGTTTVVGMLLNLNSGSVLAVDTDTNPQGVYGADVISRIKAACAPGGLNSLSKTIRQCLNGIIEKLCCRSGVTCGKIYMVTIAGNTAMEHLLAGILPASLVRYPYVPVFDCLPPLAPGALELDINPGGRVVLLPNIAGFIGADTVAAILAVDQDVTDKLTLMIDLGTNGELVLGSRDRLQACSTAAGPAFEGAHLRDGMRASAGAIGDVTITDDVYVKTIGGAKARGICGSGVVKAVAEMLRAGILTSAGRFMNSSEAAMLPEKIRNRLTESDKQREFILVYAGESFTGRNISITQNDVRELQLVKSSISTGIQILMESMGAGLDDVEQVLIAGAFGNYIDIDSALAIGLIPLFTRGKIRSVGNAAGAGAAMAMMSAGRLQRCHTIAGIVDFIELAAHGGFQKRFLNNLSFAGVKA